ncbi:MAG: CBS domain-containing protein [Actinomycetota bacterium]
MSDAFRVGDLMRRWFERVEPGSTIVEAARLMIFTAQHVLPVADDGRLVGMIAERDIFDRLLRNLSQDVHSMGFGAMQTDMVEGYRQLAGRRVDEVMTTRLVTCIPDMPALYAAGIMRSRRIQRLPVIEEDRLVGLIFLSDIHAALVGASVRAT